LNVTVIPTRNNINSGQCAPKRLRVAAYCRVSTEEEEQQSSYEQQVRYFTDKITGNPEWELVGIYADDGITGTTTKKRDEFNKMIQACRKKRIDLILCKSISRFSRNLLDSIKYTRQLSENGIRIIFEKEGIDTSHQQSETWIAMMGTFAQGESESISGNVKWGIRKKMGEGRYEIRCYGYTKGKNTEISIIPEQAGVVERVFKEYISGKSVNVITDGLNADKIPSPRGGEWHISIVQKMLSNEKYAGDAVLQKTYIKSVIDKQVVRNHGEIPMWHVSDGHPAVIPRELFNSVQLEIARRKNVKQKSDMYIRSEKGKYSSVYALTGMLYCGECGKAYRRCVWQKKGKRRVVWRCINRLEYGKKYCHASPTVEEEVLQKTVLEAINELLLHPDTLKENIDECIKGAVRSYGCSGALIEIENQIRTINQKMIEIAKTAALAGQSPDYFSHQLEELSNQARYLKEKLDFETQKENILKESENNLNSIVENLNGQALKFDEFDDTVVRMLIERIDVLENNEIQIIFTGGYTVKKKLKLYV
jgi:DNA invertase Pin-like site-specific DNA recombinase